MSEGFTVRVKQSKMFWMNIAGTKAKNEMRAWLKSAGYFNIKYSGKEVCFRAEYWLENVSEFNIT